MPSRFVTNLCLLLIAAFLAAARFAFTVPVVCGSRSVSHVPQR